MPNTCNMCYRILLLDIRAVGGFADVSWELEACGITQGVLRTRQGSVKGAVAYSIN